MSPPQRAAASLGRAVSYSVAMSAMLLLQPRTAHAGSLEDANTKLQGYGLPPLLFVPPGFQTIVSEYGRGNAKEKIENPIVVQFCAPNLWIAKKTSVNKNGESGTISAGDYAKGDSAFLFTEPQQAGQSVSVDNKAYLNALIQRCKFGRRFSKTLSFYYAVAPLSLSHPLHSPSLLLFCSAVAKG